MIGDFCDVTDGIHTSIDYDEESCVNLISATSPRENYFDLSRNAKISEKAHADNPRTALRLHDVVLSTVGTIGNCAVVDQNVLPANSDRHVGIIRVKRNIRLMLFPLIFCQSTEGCRPFGKLQGMFSPICFCIRSEKF